MKIPHATYRIQFTPSFGFKDALAIVDYLADLGGFWLYASPIFEARKGSLHGYDAVNPNRLNPELGTEAEFDEVVAALHQHEMGWLQDVVPNHLAYTGENPMIADLFALGENSAFADFFDILWDHPSERLSGKVSAPFLGDRLAACLERGEVRLALREGTLGAAYYEHFFPLQLFSYAILDPEIPGAGVRLAEDAGTGFLNAVRKLVLAAEEPPSPDRDGLILEQKESLQRLVDGHPALRRFIERRLESFDPKKGGPEAVASLKRLLSDQLFRLRYWRTATKEINYRRFFDINELICLRQELPAVFDRTHRLLDRLVARGQVDGVRIDHIDGMRDPGGYLRRLRQTCGDVYIAVEKILGPEEPLPRSWPVEGATGYEFADKATRLFCPRDRQQKISAVYHDFSGRKEPFAEICRSAKRQMLQEAFAGDLANFVDLLFAAAKEAGERAAAEKDVLIDAVTELLVRFPIYRTYAGEAGAAGGDAALVRDVAKEAAAEAPSLGQALGLLCGILLAEDETGSLPGIEASARGEVAARFQQLCALLAAKGVEDTALYRYHRLCSLNEVGGDPSRIGISRSSFHSFLIDRAENWPHAVNTLSTHDTKRSEDVRARINVLSEIPEEWRLRCEAWKEANRTKKELSNGTAVPGANTEYLLYQTLAGSFPFDPEDREDYGGRICNYMVKAVREAKEHTSWLAADTAYEEALCRFIDRLLFPPEKDDPFMADFLAFAKMVSRFGVYNSLSQTLIKITAPGVPDFYQGTELFDFSLVDPDNRRAVDFVHRKKLLKEILGRQLPGPPEKAQRGREKGDYDRMKLYLVYAGLQTRKHRPALFRDGRFEPVYAAGRFAAHVVAFARIHGGQYSLTAVPRWLTTVVPDGREPLGDVWQDTALTLDHGFPTTWTNAVSGERYNAVETLPLEQIFGRFPAALLTGEVKI